MSAQKIDIDYQSLAEAHGKLANKLGADLSEAAHEIAALRKALRGVIEVWDATGWMARNYAEAGGDIGPEMRSYQEAAEIVEKARQVLNPKTAGLAA